VSLRLGTVAGFALLLEPELATDDTHDLGHVDPPVDPAGDTLPSPPLTPSEEQAARDLDDSIGAARSRAAPPDNACVVCHGTGRGPYCRRCRATGKEPPGAPPVPGDP
jgi:hypothetical protein